MTGPGLDITDIVLSAGSSVAVVGMAKNCGKTVTLGAILEGVATRGIPVGVASAGRDGEDVDAVTMLPKPPIRLPEGALFATAERLAAKARAPIEPVAVTRHTSALGRLLVYRAVGPGKVEVGGGNSAAAAHDAVALMRRLGARFVAIDGAAGRKFSCAPSLVQTTVLATGAALAATMEGVVRRTTRAVRTLIVPEWMCPAGAEAFSAPLSHRDVVFVRGDASSRRIVVPSVLARADEVARALTEDVETVLLGGALTGGLLRAILKRGRASGLTVVVRDATRILVEPGDLDRFWSAGGLVAAVHPVRLVAVTTNPTAPDGRLLDPAALLDGVAHAVAPVPAFDVVAGIARNLPAAGEAGSAGPNRCGAGGRIGVHGAPAAPAAPAGASDAAIVAAVAAGAGRKGPSDRGPGRLAVPRGDEEPPREGGVA